ncbi:MAG: SurA N-terminal domain-containing protein [Hyphomicrobiaceae bacterium]
MAATIRRASGKANARSFAFVICAGLILSPPFRVIPAAAQTTDLPGVTVRVPDGNARQQDRGQTSSSAPQRGSASAGQNRTAIALRVNDDIITNFEIEERARLLALSANLGERARAQFQSLVQSPRTNERLRAILQRTIEENQGKSREQILAIFERRKEAFGRQLQEEAMRSAQAGALPQLRKAAREELIEERLKVLDARNNGVEVTDEEVNEIFGEIAKRNNMTGAQFEQHLAKLGASAQSMKARFRANIAWSRLLSRRYRMRLSVSEREIDTFLGQSEADDETKLRLHRITLPLAANLDQAQTARQLRVAEGLRSRFRGCQSTGELAGSAEGARFDDLGEVTADRVTEPTRSLLLSAKVGEMAPPSLGSNGVELYALCGKSAGASLEARERAQREIQQRELDALGRRHLADLMRDAHIEPR